MPQMRLKDFAAAKGWTKQNLQVKLKRGIISANALVKKNGVNVAIISEIADADLSKNANQFKAELYRAAGHNAGNAHAKIRIGDDLTKHDEDDWLEAELQDGDDAKQFVDEVLAQSKPKEIPKPKKEEREINGEKVTATVLPPDSDDMSRFRNAKTSKEELSARKLELEVAETEGRLLDTEGVRKRIVKLVANTKDTLSNLPGKLAPLLVGITDPVEMETTLQREINNACESLYKLSGTQWNQNEKDD